jgi:ribosomal protein S18 acetylase RimI-like enzyme
MDSDAFRGQPTLNGETIRLEPFGPEHLDHAWAGLADTEMLRLTGSHATFTREQVDAFGRDVAHRDDRADWQATRLVLGYAFDTVRLHRVSLEVYSFNPRAQHVYSKCGFVVEGRQRDALCWDGRWYDAIVMGILETDPR